MNFVFKIKGPLLCIAFALGVLLPISASAQRQHTLTGDIRQHKGFHSKLLNNHRDLVIYLPPGYEANPKRRYSVLYLHDGQNLFDGATSYIPGKEWQIDETAQRLIAAAKIEPLIIVGVNNTGKDRIDEYTPIQDTKRKIRWSAKVGRLAKTFNTWKPKALSTTKAPGPSALRGY